MRRLPRRLVRHHLPIGIAICLGGSLLYTTYSSADTIERLSFASAYPALILLSLSLLIGPVKVISGERVPVSIDLRRDVGIWAGLTGVFHATVGQFVHLRGRPWLYYVYDNWREQHSVPFRHDLFGLANYTGLSAALILLLLLCLSNDASLRRLRPRGWKRLQRWNYAIFALIAVHTLLYQLGIESQSWPFVATAIAAFSVTSLVQWRAYRMQSALPGRSGRI